MHILVVDDDPAVRSSLHRALRLEGYSVGLAGDGSEALAAVEADAPDVIVLDLMMPPPDGLEVCRRLRRAGNHTPILMLTAREAGGDPRLIHTVRGAGYALREPGGEPACPSDSQSNSNSDSHSGPTSRR